jgi:hypothetical protein
MAYHQLGRGPEAQAALERARQLVKKVGPGVDAQSRSFLQEAEELLGGK